MKLRLFICCSGLLLALTAHAGISYGSYADGGLIPDGNPVGMGATATVSGYGSSISDISVNLNIGGPSPYIGDLYAYLSYSGVLVPLLNRVGVATGNAFGYSDAGMNITLSDSGANNIHFYQNYSRTYSGGQLTGTWRPDGQTTDPRLASSSPNSFSNPGTVTFAALNGLNPNGTWTLFIADLSAGSQSQLDSWSLNISAVPEPVNVALGIFGGVFLVVILATSRPVRNRVHCWRLAVAHWIDAV
ncbi:MAG: hypothetical protein ABSD29_05080 [Verrucomicrobiota bacterium]|jgi:hypothetical protein